MPYPRAHYYIAFLLLLTVPAFWRNYFSQFGAVDWQWHVHGLTAGAWMLLLIWQSWSIHHGRRGVHRLAGKALFVVAPLFIAGGLLAIGAMAGRTGAFAQMFSARLALLDLVSLLAFAVLVHGALRERAKVALHARYMVATVFFLVAPILSRLLPGFAPGLTIRSLEELPRFATGLQISQALTILIALSLYSWNHRHGKPWLIAMVILIAQSALFETLGKSAAWVDLYAGFASVPPAVFGLVGIAVGALVVYLGWSGGAKKSPAEAGL